MPEFYGTDFQIKIQERMIARHNWIANTPAIANGGRVLNILEPETIGWNRVKEFVEEDGTVALTAMERAGAADRLRDVFGTDHDFPCWDVHISPSDRVLAFCQTVLAGFTPQVGWRMECLACPDDSELAAIQTLNLATGVAPLPGPYLRGKLVPSFTSCIWTSTGELAAVSNVTQRYHPNSRFAGYVFNGSTSSSPDHRGLGLGKAVTAHVLVESHRRLAWSHALAQVAPNNAASKRMVEACGLSCDPSLATLGVVSRGVTFTR